MWKILTRRFPLPLVKRLQEGKEKKASFLLSATSSIFEIRGFQREKYTIEEAKAFHSPRYAAMMHWPNLAYSYQLMLGKHTPQSHWEKVAHCLAKGSCFPSEKTTQPCG